MDDLGVRPLPLERRKYLFFTLLGLFILSLPFLFLYAAGYRIDFGKAAPFVSTGGLYVAAERTGAEIYIDGELVRETRTFRKAFYAQGLEPGTHRVHVQKDDAHTWVKELPVYPHLVTEAQTFNLPLEAQVRTISPWKNAAGETVIFDTPLQTASSTNAVTVATTTATRTLIPDTEYATLVSLFVPATSTVAAPGRTGVFPNQPTEEDSGAEVATTTKNMNGVRLSKIDDDVYATFVGSREQMPYYYCAKDFEFSEERPLLSLRKEEKEEDTLLGPVQYLPEGAECDPVIRIDRLGEVVTAFEFYPGSSDFVLMALESGIYVVEVDDRSWQNAQPLLLGENLAMRLQNGNVYVYDGTLIYQVLIES